MQMLRALRARSVRSATGKLIVAALVSGVLVFLISWGSGAHHIFTGGQSLAQVNLMADDLDGLVVTFEADSIMDTYAVRGERRSDGSVKTESVYYSVLSPDWNYMLAVEVPASMERRMDDMMELQWAGYMDGSYDYANPAPSIRLVGTLTRLSSQESRYFNEELEYWGVERADGVRYALRVNQSPIGAFWVVYVIYGMALFVFLISLWRWLRAVTGAGQKALRAYIRDRGNAEALDAWWPVAEKAGRNIWLHPDFVINQTGGRTVFAELRDVVWAFKRTTRTNGIATSHQLVLQRRDKKAWYVNGKSADIDAALDFLMRHCDWIAIGHTPELLRLYRQDPEMLVGTARSQREGLRRQGEEEPPAGGFAQPQDPAALRNPLREPQNRVDL